MNATNRVVNRLLLLVTALVLLGAGTVAIAAGAVAYDGGPGWLRDPARQVDDAVAAASGATVEIVGVGAVSIPVLVAALAGITLLVLLIVFLATRGGGRSASVLEQGGTDGRTIVDRSVADAVLGEPLLRRRDVVSAHAAAHVVRRTRTIRLAVRVQPDASLVDVMAAVDRVVSDWDRMLGSRVPVVVHVSDRSWRDVLRPRTRVQ